MDKLDCGKIKLRVWVFVFKPLSQYYLHSFLWHVVIGNTGNLSLMDL